MKYSVLGQSGIKVSQVALGCWSFAGGNYWGEQQEQLSIDTVHAALDCGINFMDTAEGYGDGESERVLGKALKGRRSEAVIATKVDWTHLAPNDIITSCERSLKYLQTDYIDLYYIHWPNPAIELSESLAQLQKLKESGKIRSIAVCNFGPGNLQKLEQAKNVYSSIDAHQLPYSLFWRAIESEIAPASEKLGMGIVCYSALAQGLLTGRYTSVDQVPNNMKITRYYDYRHVGAGHGEDGCEAEIFHALDELAHICSETGYTMPQLATAWVLAQPNVCSVLSGARTPEEIRENALAGEITLTADLIEKLSSLSSPIKAKLGANPDMWKNTQNSRFI